MTTDTTANSTTTTPASTSTDGADQQHAQQDVDNAFSAGFGNEEAPGTSTAPAAASPTKKDDATSPASAAAAAAASSATSPAPKPAPSTEGPKFAGLGEEEIKKLLDQVPENSRQYAELKKQLRQVSGWIGTINDQLGKLPKPSASASAAAPAANASKSILESEAMKKLKDDLPDVHQAIVDALAAIPAPAAGGPSKEDLEKLVQGRVAEAIGTFRAEQSARERNRLYKAHPDLREAAAKVAPTTKLLDLLPGFRLWLSAQPAEYQQDVANSDDASTVSEAFTKFKEHQKQGAVSAEEKAKADAEAKRKAEEEAQRKTRQHGRLERAAAPSGVPAASHSGRTALDEFNSAFKGE